MPVRIIFSFEMQDSFNRDGDNPHHFFQIAADHVRIKTNILDRYCTREMVNHTGGYTIGGDDTNTMAADSFLFI